MLKKLICSLLFISSVNCVAMDKLTALNDPAQQGMQEITCLNDLLPFDGKIVVYKSSEGALSLYGQAELIDQNEKLKACFVNWQPSIAQVILHILIRNTGMQATVSCPDAYIRDNRNRGGLFVRLPNECERKKMFDDSAHEKTTFAHMRAQEVQKALGLAISE